MFDSFFYQFLGTAQTSAKAAHPKHCSYAVIESDAKKSYICPYVAVTVNSVEN